MQTPALSELKLRESGPISDLAYKLGFRAYPAECGASSGEASATWAVSVRPGRNCVSRLQQRAVETLHFPGL